MLFLLSSAAVSGVSLVGRSVYTWGATGRYRTLHTRWQQSFPITCLFGGRYIFKNKWFFFLKKLSHPVWPWKKNSAQKTCGWEGARTGWRRSKALHSAVGTTWKHFSATQNTDTWRIVNRCWRAKEVLLNTAHTYEFCWHRMLRQSLGFLIGIDWCIKGRPKGHKLSGVVHPWLPGPEGKSYSCSSSVNFSMASG